MQGPSDETLIAYLDGELAGAERLAVAQALAEDDALRARAQRLNDSTRLIRAAYDAVLREPVPERLIAAARAKESDALIRRVVAQLGRWRDMMGERAWWIGAPAAASLAGIVLGAGLGYFVASQQGVTLAAQQAALNGNLTAANWLDNIAGYHKLFINAGPDDRQLMDVPADGNTDALRKAGQLPSDFHLPDLKPWGLAFQGARFLVVEGQPSTQLFYTTDNQALGPLTVVVASSSKPDLAPTFDRRGDLNLLYWRHHGHEYALVGTADIGYLWNISNDIAWQLDAI
ncbi:MAG: anti-sigma factor family protein [Stellaceae bacterium]